MTQISLTSGQILDIIANLDGYVDALQDAEEYTLAAYYGNMVEQFELLHDKLQDFLPEDRVANLILAAN